MQDVYKIFAERVRELRKTKNLSQGDYADHIGVHSRTISSIETAKHSTHFDVVKRISEVEKIPLCQLFMTEKELQEFGKQIVSKNIDSLLAKLDSEQLDTVKKMIELIVKEK